MGRFYQTAQPSFVDNKMFEAPHELRRQVLLGKDKVIDDTISNAVTLSDKLSADVLKQDNPRAKEIVAGYEQQINDIVSGIKKNPLEYNKFSEPIRNLGRGINKDWSMGEVALLQQNKKDLVAHYSKIDELAKKDPEKYTADYITALKTAATKNYTEGAKYNSETSIPTNSLDLKEATALPNLFEEFSKSADKMTADGKKIEQAYPGGPFIYKNGDNVEELTPDKLAQAFGSWVQSRTDLVGAVEQRKSLGLPEFQTADANKIYSYEPVGKDSKNKKLSFSDNYYGKNAAAIANTFKYKKTEHQEDIKDNGWYQKNAEWARADAKEKADKESEHVDLAPVHVYTLGTETTKSLSENLNVSNIALASKQKNLTDNATSLGLKPGTEIYKAFTSGDVNTMVSAGMDAGTASKMSAEYRAERTKKNLLNDQVQGFRDYLKTKNKPSSEVGKMGWTKDKNLAHEYNNWLKLNGTFDVKKNVVNNLSSFNNMNIPAKTIKEAQEVFSQNFEHLTFNIDQTYKGQNLAFEDANGNNTVFIPQDSKIKSGTRTTDKNGKETIYLKAPDGNMSMSDLLRRGLVQKIQKEDADGNVKETFVTRQNGKNVGVIVNDKTLRVVNALDDRGKSNYSSTLQIGNNRMDILVPTEQMPIPSVDAYISDNYDDLQFNKFLNQSNLSTLGRRVSTGPSGSKFVTDKGKAYIEYSNGKKTEVTDPVTKRQIYKINYFEND